MVHSLLTKIDSERRWKLKQPIKFVVAYSLFRRDAVTGRYIRLSDAAYTDKRIAQTVFRDRVIQSGFKLAIRAID